MLGQQALVHYVRLFTQIYVVHLLLHYMNISYSAYLCYVSHFLNGILCLLLLCLFLLMPQISFCFFFGHYFLLTAFWCQTCVLSYLCQRCCGQEISPVIVPIFCATFMVVTDCFFPCRVTQYRQQWPPRSISQIFRSNLRKELFVCVL